MRQAFGKASLVTVGVALFVPLALVLSALLLVESRVRVPVSAGPGTGDRATASGSAQTFSMTIYEQGRTVRLWLKDLDSAPYFRQTIEVNGQQTSDQLYRFDERTLYTAKPDASGKLSWSSVAGIDPARLQLTSLASGPGAWAAQYGPGEKNIPLAQGTLRVTIHSVGEILDSAAFQLPQGANPVPANG